MSRYKPYPAYKESGVEWLGQVPSHWTVCKLSFRYSIELGKMLDEKKLTKTSLIPYLRNQDVQWDRINTYDLPEMDIHPEELDRYTIRHGDLLVCEGGDVGRAAIWRGGNAVFGYQKALHRLRHRSPSEDTAAFFFFSLLTAKQRGVFEESDSKATIAHLPAEKFRQYRFAFPPLDEQNAITAKLDRETARIDALIEKKTRFIDLLREKRQALITHAVTKGLDPNVKMKDSGVEWLGEVPEHWKVKPFKTCIDFQEGPGIMAADFCDSGVPLLRVAGVQGRWASLKGCNHLSPAKVERQWNHFRLAQGDLLISASASMGSVCEVDGEGVGAIAYTGLIRLRGKQGVMLRPYIRSLVVSSLFSNQIELFKAGSTIQHFGPIHLSQMLVLCPPLDEQAAIAQHLEDETLRIDQLIDKSERSIELIKERRSALITAAVTGQIDLREAA